MNILKKERLENESFFTKENRSELEMLLLLRLKEKVHLYECIKSCIIRDIICSERLTDIYHAYINFSLDRKTLISLKKKCFKTTFKFILHEMNIPVNMR